MLRLYLETVNVCFKKRLAYFFVSSMLRWCLNMPIELWKYIFAVLRTLSAIFAFDTVSLWMGLGGSWTVSFFAAVAPSSFVVFSVFLFEIIKLLQSVSLRRIRPLSIFWYASIQSFLPKKYKYSSENVNLSILNGTISFLLSKAKLTSLLTCPDAFVLSDATKTSAALSLIACTIWVA